MLPSTAAKDGELQPADSLPTSFSREELLASGRGDLYGLDRARLPLPPMLMFDRIVTITETDPKRGGGIVHAEMDVDPEAWFFGCHFYKDPVMPGCLGLDALWQLLGFYMVWRGHKGNGRALGAKNVKFNGQVMPTNKLLRYEVDVRRVISQSSLVIAQGNGTMLCDGEVVYSAEGLRVGLFESV